MKYVVFRVATNAEGGVAPSAVGTYDDRLVAESNYHDQVADAATKVSSGRMCDGAFLVTSEGEYLESKFYSAS